MDDTIGNKADTRSRLLEAARGIVPLIRDAAEQAERDRRVSAAVVAAIRAAGLHRALKPRRFGGHELDFGFLVDVNWEWGAECASTAWVGGILLVHQWLLGQLPIQAQHDVWDAEPDALLCGSYAPSGNCERVPGGFRVSATWGFASGCDVADWALVGAMLPLEKPTPAFLLIPRSDLAIEDNWFTMGLCATGSKNLVAKNVFVPEHRHVAVPQLTTGNSPGAQAHGTPLFRMPMLAAIPSAISSPALGALRGAVRDFVDSTRVRVTRGAALSGGARMADFAGVQSRVAEASACVDSARLLLMRDLAETHAAAERGEPIDAAMRIRNRLTHAAVVDQCKRGIDALWTVAGGHAIFSNTRLQRSWRDIHAIGKHVSFNWDAVSTMYGQWALGLEPKGQY